MILDETATPTVVFTADFAGLYVLSLEPNASGQVLALNGAAIGGSRVGGFPGPQANFSVYMRAGDELSYVGPDAELFGYRIGSEL